MSVKLAGRAAYLEQVKEYREKLFAFRDEESIKTLKQMLVVMVEDIKSQLLKAEPEVVAPLQAEALAYNTILLWVTAPVSRIPQGEQKS